MMKKILLSASALAGGMLLAANAFAQTTQDQLPDTSTTAPKTSVQERADENSNSDEEIVITGSRIRVRNTIDAAVPIATISAAELLGTRGDVSLGDALNQLPQLRSTFSQANSTGSIGTAGLSLLDLRGLGTARTLTLVNGRRVVSAVPGSYTPDVSTIPYDLVESVDLVTGGNSAIYGSDAIAGVVNFKLRRNYDGFRIRGQGGVTSYGDRGSYLISGIAGHNYLDGRLNVTVSGEYSRANAVYYADRPYLGAYGGTPGFITSQITTAPNRNFDGIPNVAYVNRGIVFGNRSTGGTIVATCPTAVAGNAANAAQRAANCTGQTNPTGTALAYNYVFRPDGSIIRDSPSTTGLTDNRVIGGGFLFGETATGVEDAMLMPSQDRFVGNLIINGNFSKAFQPFLEATVVKILVGQQSVQPTFNGSTLTASYSYNNPFLTPASRATLLTILNPTAAQIANGTFTLNRFNNDFGTRAEFHDRRTYRGVLGVQGDISETGNLHYEVAGNYGRTENFYRTGGNVLVANYNRAANAVLAPATFTGNNFVLNSAGQRVICGVNATTNVDPACFPLNPFGRSAFDPRALNYVLYTSTRNQWAEQIDATAFLSGDSSGLFSLPGGAVGFAAGLEYRREDAFSGQDAVTASGATFLNSAATFDPPAIEVKEVYGELRVPLLAKLPVFNELTAEGAVRVSDYGGRVGRATAWNGGAIWSPFRGLTFRATYARSVRAPNISNLYASQSVTFLNGLVDPCNQAAAAGVSGSSNITTNPNRVRNCAAAGIPTTIINPTTGATVPWSNLPASGVQGVNQGNIGLTPEIGNSFTVGTVFAPEAIPGLVFKVDYYNIRVKNVISGLSGQAIIDRCYDDPTGINNIFCAAVFRRQTNDPNTNFTFNGQTTRTIDTVQVPGFALAGNGISFINQPYNFALLKTRGIDFDASYVRSIKEDLRVNLRMQVSYVMDRLSYSYIAEPGRFDRFDSTLGDPRWQGQLSAAVEAGPLEVSYNARYVGKQIVQGFGYETFFTNQGRGPTNPEARPFVFYDPIIYHNIRIGVNATDKFRFYFGVDNVSNELPPYGLSGTGDDAIYPNTGRFLYAGVEARF